jgi:carboxyl-terminal processing protease
MNHIFRPVLVIFLFSSLKSPAQSTRRAAELAFTITRMAEISHVQPRVVDQSFSNDLFNQMIRALDADKIYFNGEDIGQLQAFRFVLSEQLLNERDDFLKLLIELFTRKVNQTDSILDRLSRSRFNLNLSESYTVLEDSSFAATEAARKIKIYKLVKRNMLETIVDIYEEDSTKKYILPDSLQAGLLKGKSSVCGRPGVA